MRSLTLALCLVSLAVPLAAQTTSSSPATRVTRTLDATFGGQVGPSTERKERQVDRRHGQILCGRGAGQSSAPLWRYGAGGFMPRSAR